ncbi:MAG TPA: hypothetical protein VNZ52_09670, partial [Candidatus Thermoplasmatota archaeon]|nr:hypothetical protein [Candidatus Thermoplasmatota archaeon]
PEGPPLPGARRMDRMGLMLVALVGVFLIDFALMLYYSRFSSGPMTHEQKLLLWAVYFGSAFLFAWVATRASKPSTRWSTLKTDRHRRRLFSGHLRGRRPQA